MLRQMLNFLLSAFRQFFPELKIFAIAVKKRDSDTLLGSLENPVRTLRSELIFTVCCLAVFIVLNVSICDSPLKSHIIFCNTS